MLYINKDTIAQPYVSESNISTITIFKRLTLIQGHSTKDVKNYYVAQPYVILIWMMGVL